MATFKYFSGTQEIKNISPMKNAEFAAKFPGVKGRRYDGFSMQVGHPVSGPDQILPVERIIAYKSNPSLHVCNSKCVNGKVNGTCECSCRGKNHGLGSVMQSTFGKPMNEILKAA